MLETQVMFNSGASFALNSHAIFFSGVTSMTRFCVPQEMSVLPLANRCASPAFSTPVYSQTTLPSRSTSRTAPSPSCAARMFPFDSLWTLRTWRW